MSAEPLDQSVHFVFKMLYPVTGIAVHRKAEPLTVQNVDDIDYHNVTHI